MGLQQGTTNNYRSWKRKLACIQCTGKITAEPRVLLRWPAEETYRKGLFTEGEGRQTEPTTAGAMTFLGLQWLVRGGGIQPKDCWSQGERITQPSRSCDKALPLSEPRPKQKGRRNSYQILSSHFSSPAGSSQLESRWVSLQENGSMGRGSSGLTSAAYKGKDWVVTSQNRNLPPGRRFQDWIGIS